MKWVMAAVALGAVALFFVASRRMRVREQAELETLAIDVLKTTHPTWAVSRSGPLQLNVKIGREGAVIHLDNAAHEAAGDHEVFRDFVSETASILWSSSRLG